MARWSPERTRAAAGLGIVTLIAAVVLVMAFTGFLTPLFVPKGTTFLQGNLYSWVVNFDVPASGGRVVGAWTAYNVTYPPSLVVVNGTLAAPEFSFCPRIVVSFPELNGSVNTSVSEGPHTLYWSSCSRASRIVLTESIVLA